MVYCFHDVLCSNHVCWLFVQGELLKGFFDLPVFRTTSQGSRPIFCFRFMCTYMVLAMLARMLDSAQVILILSLESRFWYWYCWIWFSLHFAAGFFGVQSYQSQYHQLITIEGEGFNNTLAPYFQCPNSNNPFGSAQINKWDQIYLNAALKRLSPFIRGYQLQLSDLVAMQQLCAYEVYNRSSVFILERLSTATNVSVRLLRWAPPSFVVCLQKPNGRLTSTEAARICHCNFEWSFRILILFRPRYVVR